MIDYILIYDAHINNSFSIFDEILSSLLSYLFFFVVWRIFTEKKFKKIGIVLTLIYIISTIHTLYEKSSKENVSTYRVAEGEVSNWVKASYYNRRDGSFMVNGVKFKTTMHGIDDMFNHSLDFNNGRRVRINYVEGHKIVKFWIEDYAVILEDKCHDNNYSACFQASRRYQDRNRTKAKELVLKSTESNSSQYSLVVSKLYEHGILFEKNTTKANLFLKKASEKSTSLYRKDERVKKEKVTESKDDSFDILGIMD